MFDTICTLPLPFDLITLAVHPKLPVIAVGLVSGHVYCFRLPSVSSEVSNVEPSPNASHLLNGVSRPSSSTDSTNLALKEGTQPRRSSLTHSSSAPSSSNGYGTVETLWKTRRHKGSCRALAYSQDGNTLFSVGADGIIKSADASSGGVLSKVSVPGVSLKEASKPLDHGASAICVLNAQHLLVGNEDGTIHVFPLMTTGKGGHLHFKSETPSGSYRPHEDGLSTGHEPITSIVPLPPSATSTSKFCRSWATIAGSTLAVCDLYKGVVACSEYLGGKSGEELLCVASHLIPSTGRKQDSEQDCILLTADSGGLISMFPRGQWKERAAGIRVKNVPSNHGRLQNMLLRGDDDIAIECMALRNPQNAADNNQTILAAGTAGGSIRFLTLSSDVSDGKEAGQKAATPVAKATTNVITHDERAMDGVTALGFDVEGRLVSGGGKVIKIWNHQAHADSGAAAADNASNDEEGGDESEESGEDISASESASASGEDEDDLEAELRDLKADPGLNKLSKLTNGYAFDDQINQKAMSEPSLGPFATARKKRKVATPDDESDDDQDDKDSSDEEAPSRKTKKQKKKLKGKLGKAATSRRVYGDNGVARIAGL